MAVLLVKKEKKGRGRNRKGGRRGKQTRDTIVLLRNEGRKTRSKRKTKGLFG